MTNLNNIQKWVVALLIAVALMMLISLTSCNRRIHKTLERTRVDSLVYVERLVWDTLYFPGERSKDVNILQINNGRIKPLVLKDETNRSKLFVKIDSTGIVNAECECKEWKELLRQRSIEFTKAIHTIANSQLERTKAPPSFTFFKYAALCITFLFIGIILSKIIK